MSFSYAAIAVIAAYSAASVAYVYRWRGRVRYPSFAVYLRKSWAVFAPLNCLLYMSTRASARRAVLGAVHLDKFKIIKENWQVIRDEAMALQASGAFDAARAPGSVGFYDVGFRTFYKRGWRHFYLKWYGTTHRSAERSCPKTVALLNQVPEVNGAMFSLLPPGAELSLHSDPLACSFRYHLGLATPNSEMCRIYVDGVSCAWYDGEHFVFDETYPHHARNDTNTRRLILMCDVDRPMNAFGRAFNRAYRVIASGTVVPNTTEDRRGLFNKLFAALIPFREKSLRLRERNFTAYKALQLSFNTTLIALVIMVLFAVFWLIETALPGGT